MEKPNEKMTPERVAAAEEAVWQALRSVKQAQVACRDAGIGQSADMLHAAGELLSPVWEMLKSEVAVEEAKRFITRHSPVGGLKKVVDGDG